MSHFVAYIWLLCFFFISLAEVELLTDHYREDLDRFAQEQRRQKLIERIDQLNSYPDHNLESLREYDQAYQQNQQMQRQKIRDSLDENYRLYMDKKYKMVNEPTQRT